MNEAVVRIAQVAPLYESVPPRFYGGTERVVSYLTEALVEQGHDVVLYASGDSSTSAELRAPWPRSLRLDERCMDELAPHVLMIEHVCRDTGMFDIVHWHIEGIHFPMARRMGTPHVTTLHGRLDIPELEPLFREFADIPLVSISDAQREPLAWAAWQATVPHGLPLDLHAPGDGAGGYLAFLGRISPEKRVDLAIEIARRAGLPLKIAAKIDRADREYYAEVVRPLLGQPGIEYVGEISEAEKSEFLGSASALLFPIDWPEPFGLVMIEAMACGTPTVAFHRGSVPEVITEGVSGFVCRSVDEAVTAVQRLAEIDRRRCREEFEQRFSASRMAWDYSTVYRRLIEQGNVHGRADSHRRSLLHPGDVASGG